MDWACFQTIFHVCLPTLQMPWNLLDESGVFQASEHHQDSGKAMLEELEKWAQALQAIRRK